MKNKSLILPAIVVLLIAVGGMYLSFRKNNNVTQNITRISSLGVTASSTQNNDIAFASPIIGDVWTIGQTRKITFNKSLPYDGHCVNQLYLVDSTGKTVGALGLSDYETALSKGGTSALWNGQDLWPSICGTSNVSFKAQPGTYRLMMHEEDTGYGVGKTIEFYSGYFTLKVPVQAKNNIQFQAHISDGQSFEKDIGNGMIFKLRPDSKGWSISINSKTAKQDDFDFTLATPPFHGITALEIEGWHFGSMDAPQEIRDFSFVLNKQDASTMADAINQFTEGKTMDFNPKISFLGKGELVISNLKLGNVKTGSQAWIESMDFSVNLHYPLPFSEYLK